MTKVTIRTTKQITSEEPTMATHKKALDVLHKKKFLRQGERAECRRLRQLAILKGEE